MKIKQFFSTKEAAEYLNLGVRSIYYHLYRAKDLRSELIGNSLMFTREELDRFHSNKRPSGRPKSLPDGSTNY